MQVLDDQDIGMARFPLHSCEDVRAELLARREIALLDVREEDPHARAHPLFAANLAVGRIELEAYSRLPRRTVPITVFDNGEGLADIAAERLRTLGYSNVGILEGGLGAWRDGGGELFRDVNVPSKAFGELVEANRHTPSLSPEKVRAMLDKGEDVVLMDARRFDEYRTMSIPTAISVPGGELVRRVGELAPQEDTTVIVHCGGRTRSIIGTQSLLNAGVKNRVFALRNGTIGWLLAGLDLEHGRTNRGDITRDPPDPSLVLSARALADRAGVLQIHTEMLETWLAQGDRSIYRFDVRTPEEYVAGHLHGFRSAPGGQLVQETDVFAPVRGARIVLVDSDGIRANMTASWLAQMGWETCVLDGVEEGTFSETGEWQAELPAIPDVPLISPGELFQALDTSRVGVIDLAQSRDYARGHIPGAWFALRWQMPAAINTMPVSDEYVLVSSDDRLARFACSELAALVDVPVKVLQGGTQVWQHEGLPLETGLVHLASPAIDRYQRPYEGIDNSAEAMQGYLDWEFGLVEQLGRDGTHGFHVV